MNTFIRQNRQHKAKKRQKTDQIKTVNHSHCNVHHSPGIEALLVLDISCKMS